MCLLLSDILSEVPSNVDPFHPCRSLASISETVAPPAGSKQSLIRRLSEPLGRACTCPSVRHVTDMEGTITFIVPELSEKTLMNVSVCVVVVETCVILIVFSHNFSSIFILTTN